ncbi:MAG: hypothetical protein Q4G35_14195, partial [Propionibacteriaceae bacterium]|nr:hypothetical protein [Propionibacteriaceae bacterium]
MIRLVWRQFAANPWPAILLVFTTALLAALAVATPRLIADLDDRQLGEKLASLSALQGDVSGTWAREVTSPDGNLDGGIWPGYEAAANNILQAQPEPLRTLLKPAQFLATAPNGPIRFVPPQESGYHLATINVYVDRYLPQHAGLTDGAWPQLQSADPGDTSPAEVAIVDKLAERMGWTPGSLISPRLVVSGVFRPTDPDDTRWQHVFYGRQYGEKADPNLGVELIAGAFLAANNAGLLAPLPDEHYQGATDYALWFGLDADAVAASGTD